MNTEPHTVDLDLLKRAAALRAEAEQAKARTEQEIAALKWDRAMTRAFKGVFPRSRRLIFMRAIMKREDVD